MAEEIAGNALLLSEETAERLGWTSAGPFTLAGVFPGEYVPGEPLAIRYLGFESDDAVADAYEAAFVDVEPELRPLEWVWVEEGEGLPLRQNHALSEAQAVEQAAQDAVEAPVTFRRHEDADKAAEELGIAFPDKATLAEKSQAIAEAVSAAAAAGDPNEVTPAPGAEGTTPVPAEPVEEPQG